MAVLIANVVTETPSFVQGETEANPSPEPSVIMISVADTATNAPAIMDGQDAADFAAVDPASIATAVPAIIVSATTFPLAMRTHRQQQNDRERNAQHPKQYSATHAKPLL